MIILTTLYNTIEFIGTIIFDIVEELYYKHWDIRKKYQTFLYKFNTYHGFKVWKNKFFKIGFKLEWSRLLGYSLILHKTWFFIFLPSITIYIVNTWYYTCIVGWIVLTYWLYYHELTRDLGPSYDIYDYNPEDDMGIYRTIGPVLLFVWLLWTLSANTASLTFIYFILQKFIYKLYYTYYWYVITIYSYIKMPFINFLYDVIEPTILIVSNYREFVKLDIVYLSSEVDYFITDILNNIHTFNSKSYWLWFPWASFFNYTTILSILYICVLLSIYNTENAYYIVLYTIFLVFLFSITLILLDLDIFAGLLLLIESVVILMLFFLIIYLTPNISVTFKIQRWKLTILTILILYVLSSFIFLNFGADAVVTVLLSYTVLEEYYDALTDFNVNDLTGVFIGFYWTNSLLLFITALLLLIASIVCVVLVSFFTKHRNFNLQSFLRIFTLVKTCYSLIFLRKQNLSKQGRSITSTRIFNKKTFNSNIYSEHKPKYDSQTTK